ncbi:MAG TPA: AAA family ATPase [Kofleriaceae bacterium]|nr:AAA family ATPase [Kofleriaceae bacterium]
MAKHDRSETRRGLSQRATLTSVSVKAFKSLHDVTVDLGHVNVLIGANGSGKSNLLESIGVIGAATSGRIDDQALLRRGIRPGVPAIYKSAFAENKIANLIKIEIESNEEASYWINITNPIQKPGPWWVFQHEDVRHGAKEIASRSPRGTKLLGKKIKLDNRASVGAACRANMETPSPVRAILDALDDYAVFAPVTPVLRGIAPDTAPRNPVGLFGGQLAEAVAMLLQGQGKAQKKELLDEAIALVDWAESFDVAEPSRAFLSPSVPTMRQVVRFYDRYMADKRNELSGYDASEGALYILFLLVLALHDHAPQIFAVDNFDQALNPRIARELTKVFARAILSRGRQAILTTHNPLVLDGLPLDDERVRLFTVARNRHGHTQVEPVEVRDLARLKAEHGQDAVSRLWLSGRLGGMPNV